MTRSSTLRPLTAVASAVLAVAALTACGGERTRPMPDASATVTPAAAASSSAAAQPAATAPAARPSGPSGSSAAARPAGSSTAPAAPAAPKPDKRLAALRRALATSDADGLDTAGSTVVRVPGTSGSGVRYRVTTRLEFADVTVEVFRARPGVPTVCVEKEPGCVVETWASAPNSISWKAPDVEGDDLTSRVEVRLSYSVEGRTPWAARVVATGPARDGFPGQEAMRALGFDLAAALAPAAAIPPD